MTEEELIAAAIARRQPRADALEAANADPLPGPLLDAILPEPLTAAGFVLRQPVASDLAILKRINSPLYRELLEMNKPVEERAGIEMSDDEAWELLFLWTRPVAEARRALGAPVQSPKSKVQGQESGTTLDFGHGTLDSSAARFREAALAATADILPFATLTEGPAIVAALAANFLRAFGAAIAYQARPTGDGTVFTPPPPAATTASAGGSTWSAASPASSDKTPGSSPTNGRSANSSPGATGALRTIPGATPSEPVRGI